MELHVSGYQWESGVIIGNPYSSILVNTHQGSSGLITCAWSSAADACCEAQKPSTHANAGGGALAAALAARPSPLCAAPMRSAMHEEDG